MSIASITPKPVWNYRSGVASCHICDGAGVVHAARRATIDDPYPETDCECGIGEHLPECEVCGFTIEVPGYDCLACQTVADIPAKLLNADTATKLAAAIMRAVAMARRDVEAPLPTACCSTVPAGAGQ